MFAEIAPEVRSIFKTQGIGYLGHGLGRVRKQALRLQHHPLLNEHAGRFTQMPSAKSI